MPAAGRSLELFYIDGRPEGLLTAQMFNWTGHVLAAPRSQIGEALSRPEAKFTGVYLLFGERDGDPLAYIGEGEDISSRVRSHDLNKDWWTEIFIVTASGNRLNKAHAKYLEARLVEEAKKIGRTPLENMTTPSRPSLSEAVEADMEAFIENLFVVLPALRVDTFIVRTRTAKGVGAAAGTSSATAVAASAPGTTRFILRTKKHNVTAYAEVIGGEFVVQAGSDARTQWAGKEALESAYARLHAELVRTGVLIPSGGKSRFKESYAFSSPSAAAAIVNGRQSNGAVEWRTEEGNVPYKDWEAEALSVEKLLG